MTVTKEQQAKLERLREQIAYQIWLMGVPDNEGNRKSWTSEIMNKSYWLDRAGSLIQSTDIAKLCLPEEKLTDEQMRQLGAVGKWSSTNRNIIRDAQYDAFMSVGEVLEKLKQIEAENGKAFSGTYNGTPIIWSDIEGAQ